MMPLSISTRSQVRSSIAPTRPAVVKSKCTAKAICAESAASIRLASQAAKDGELALNRAGQPKDDLTDVEDELVEDWQELADGLMAGIASVMDRATSYEDTVRLLPEALAHMPTGLAVDTLVRGMFKARALGDDRDA